MSLTLLDLILKTRQYRTSHDGSHHSYSIYIYCYPTDIFRLLERVAAAVMLGRDIQQLPVQYTDASEQKRYVRLPHGGHKTLSLSKWSWVCWNHPSVERRGSFGRKMCSFFLSLQS